MSADRPQKTIALPPADATPGPSDDRPSTTPPASPVQTLVQTFPPTPPGDPVRTLPQALPPAPPSNADRYQFGEEIARGGMGAVYRATDTVLRREVAVKVVQTGSEYLVRRFEDEAHITGQLQHPGIPPVYDLGRLPDGRPFLAMKLIKGQTLDALLKADGPGSGRWLAVFERVCEAVGYAHAHGVIHRDLKPSNVMVGAFGEVQVMDWGLAKVLASGGVEPHRTDVDHAATTPATEIVSAREADEATRAGSVLGTPAYMPPEQAIGAVDQIDARSDVFGLGAILCALLTGKPPYLGADAESTRQLAARGKLDDAFARLSECGVEPELVALCRRCLSAEKADRPADAGVVAAEVATLRAAAEDRAKRAELDAARLEVRATEEAKRRRVRQALVAALAVGLAASIGFGLWAMSEADRATAQEKETGKALKQVAAEKVETQRALTKVTEEQQRTTTALAQVMNEKRKTEIARTRALSALQAMTSDVAADRMLQQLALTEADQRYLRLAEVLWSELAESSDETAQALELKVHGLHQLGNIRIRLGEMAEAEQALLTSIRLYERLRTVKPTNSITTEKLALLHISLGYANHNSNNHSQAIHHYEYAAALIDKLLSTTPKSTQYRETKGLVLLNLCGVFSDVRQSTKAEQCGRSAAAVLGDLIANTKPARSATAGYSKPHCQRLLALTYSRLGLLLQDTGRLAESILFHRAGLDTIKMAIGSGYNTRDGQYDLALITWRLGSVLRSTNQPVNAESVLQDGLSLWKKLNADFPAAAKYRARLAQAHFDLGSLLRSTDRAANAVAHFRTALVLWEQLATDSPTDIAYRYQLACSHGSLGIALGACGRAAEAEQSHRAALPLFEKLAAEVPGNPEYRRQLAYTHVNLNVVLESLGRPAGAEPNLRAGLALWEQLVKQYPTNPEYREQLADTSNRLGWLFAQTGRPADAEQYYRDAIILLDKLALEFPDKPVYQNRRAYARSHLGHLLAPGRPADAVAVVTEIGKSEAMSAGPLYNFACVYAVASDKLAGKREEYARQAVVLLQRARKAGYKDAAHLAKDPDLDPLRGRLDFRWLLASLPAPPEAAPPPRPK